MLVRYRPAWIKDGFMELRSIEYFLQIADEGSITRTAQRLGVTQPALTRHVQQLEAELGTPLLLRLPRGVRLTTAGRDFLEYAQIGRAHV
jgi:LysR family transcriptional regulator, nitrogen assimilation regulatory protein